jgi:putative nucleotidyltransferase with HDIG domain
VAKALGVTDERELKAIEAGALLHDIGKLAVPDYVLNKPGALSRSEYDTMKKHANLGARILTAVDFPYPVVPIVRHHHEQWNGGGYQRARRREIRSGKNYSSRGLLDALIRPAVSSQAERRARDEMLRTEGSFYDSAVVEKSSS